MNDNRTTSVNVPMKTGIALLAFLVLLNAVFFYLLVNERRRNKDLVRTLKETNEKLGRVEAALNKVSPQTFAALTTEKKEPPQPAKAAETPVRAEPVKEARPRPEKAPAPPPAAPAEKKPVPPPAVTAEKKPATQQVAKAEKKPTPAEEVRKGVPPLERVVKLNIPPNSAPLALLSATPGEVVLVCEKEARALHIFRFTNGKFVLLKSYPCILGANNGDKRKAGDFATPKGIYFVIRYTPGNKLPGDYGKGAFVLNYPNLIDRKEGKNGNGIWLHGHDDRKKLDDLVNTKGCIVVTNAAITELTALIKPFITPIVVVDTLPFAEQQKWHRAANEITTFVSSWRQGWESLNTNKYLSFYAPDFISGDGMNFEAFKEHKEKVNSGKKSIQVKVERTAALMTQDREGKLAVVRFDQKYQSSNFNSDSRKILYLRKNGKGWQIIGESVF